MSRDGHRDPKVRRAAAGPPRASPQQVTLTEGSDPASAHTIGAPAAEGSGPILIATTGVPLREPRVGDLLGGRYSLLGELGEGGMGKVFRAHDRMADEVVAIKFLAHQGQPKQHLIERFRRELRAARKVVHPCVVRLYDILEVDGRIALSMELIDGEDLAHRLMRGPTYSPAELTQLAGDLAGALAAAHEAGVVHRDVKPANIILRRGTGRAVVTDFGISRLGAQGLPEAVGAERESLALTREGALIGTPLYMAPEQLAARADVGPEADVYAVGLVLFEAATGAVPLRASSIPLLLQARSAEPAPFLAEHRPDLGEHLTGVIQRCLASDAPARPRSGVELARALMPADPTPSPAVAPEPTRRAGRRTLALVLALGGLVSAVGGGAWWWGGRLPSSDRRVAVRVRSLGATGDAWLVAPLRRLAERSLREGRRRFEVPVDPAQANVDVAVDYRRSGDDVLLEARIGPSGGRLGERPITGRGGSVAEALERLSAPLLLILGDGQRDRPVDAQPGQAIERLGTRSAAAFASYERAVQLDFGVAVSDSDGARKHIEAAIAADPAWAHPYAFLASAEYHGSPGWDAVMQRVRTAVRDPARDPTGMAVLAAKQPPGPGGLDLRIAEFDRLHRAHPGDVLVGWTLAELLTREHRGDERIAVLGRLNAARPDLQFGADLARALEDAGRAADVEPLLARWIERAPENEQAISLLAQRRLRSGDHAGAEQLARRVQLLHGPASHRLAMLCDVLISAGRKDEARAIADQLVAGDELSRARGRRRLGEIAILEGRFAAAYESLRAAVDASRAFANDGEHPLALHELRSVARMAGHDEEAARSLDELIRVFSAIGDGALLASLVLERDCERPKGCPDVARALAALPEGAGRNLARRQLLRTAAAFGAASCTEVVKAGFSAEEKHPVSLLRFGICAEKEREWELARAALEQASRIHTPTEAQGGLPSPYHAVLARYHLGAVLEHLGRPKQARAAYEALLAHWGAADRPIHEVRGARAALERLGP